MLKAQNSLLLIYDQEKFLMAVGTRKSRHDISRNLIQIYLMLANNMA